MLIKFSGTPSELMDFLSKLREDYGGHKTMLELAIVLEKEKEMREWDFGVVC